jgi:hypothetical protein
VTDGDSAVPAFVCGGGAEYCGFEFGLSNCEVAVWKYEFTDAFVASAEVDEIMVVESGCHDEDGFFEGEHLFEFGSEAAGVYYLFGAGA